MEILPLIQMQKKEDLPDNAIPGFVAILLVNKKEYDSMYCRTKDQAKEMLMYMQRDYHISKTWNSIKTK